MDKFIVTSILSLEGIRSTFHGPMTDGMLLRALPPISNDWGALNTSRRPLSKNSMVVDSGEKAGFKVPPVNLENAWLLYLR